MSLSPSFLHRCSIVQSFEIIVSDFAQQERVGTFSFVSDLDNILLVVELVSRNYTES